MARSTTARRTKKAAMTLLGEDVRVGIYARRSTDDEHQPYSKEAQDTRLGLYTDSQPGWRLVKRFDDDASGANTERPGLAKAMAAAGKWKGGRRPFGYTVDLATRSTRTPTSSFRTRPKPPS